MYADPRYVGLFAHYYRAQRRARLWRIARTVLLVVVAAGAFLSTGVVWAGECTWAYHQGVFEGLNARPAAEPQWWHAFGFAAFMVVAVLLFKLDDWLRPARGRRDGSS